MVKAKEKMHKVDHAAADSAGGDHHHKADMSNGNDKFVRNSLTAIFIALLLDILAFTIILPLFPRLLQNYEELDGKNEVTELDWA